jgi:hypothetical protein
MHVDPVALARNLAAASTVATSFSQFRKASQGLTYP